MIQSSAQTATESPNRTIRIFGWSIITYLRILSLLFVILTVIVWTRVIGAQPDVSGRFDLLTTGGRVYSAILAVLAPVAAVGLWTTLSWGRVVWFITVLVHLLAYLGVFGPTLVSMQLLIVHVLLIVGYIFLRLGLRIVTNKS